MSDWIPLQSSNLARVRYGPDSRTLEIEFRGGRVYQYFDVPQVVFDGLRNAPSKGRYFSQSIRGHYRYARM